MAFNEKALDDYVDVAERLAEFYDRYPEGLLRPADPAKPWEQATVTGYDKDGREVTQSFIVVVAAAYRSAGDTEPGVGMAWEVFPGRTPYTRGSELMNAETSAWGRALAALGIATKRGIASRQEVQNRRAERDDGLPVNRDGSLSRSRTTDEEKDRAGVMTTAQHAEHTGLLPKAAEDKAGKARAETIDPAQWLGGEPADPDRDFDSPGTITRAQQNAMHGYFAQLGIKDRDARLTFTKGVLGLPALGSSSELSKHQAGDLLAKLEDQARTGATA